VVVHDQAGDLGLAVGGIGFFRHADKLYCGFRRVGRREAGSEG
jgi:hypothetical protein